jgi:hypothetical protein
MLFKPGINYFNRVKISVSEEAFTNTSDSYSYYVGQGTTRRINTSIARKNPSEKANK